MKVQVKKLLASAVFSLCLLSVASAKLTKQIDSIVNQPAQKKVRFSIHIVKADSAQVVYSHNANKALVPASNMKIIVGAAALKYLGPNYEYKTRVGLCGDTLVVTGAGDPLLGDKATDGKNGRENGWIFKDIAAALKQKGETVIRDIVVDSTIFDDQRVHPSWPKKELNRWYACEVSGLNYNGNCINVSAKAVGGKAIVSIEPKTGFVKVVNKVTAISKGKSAVGSYRQGEANKIIVHGKCKGKAEPFAVAIERPATFFGYLLAEELIRAGINVEGELFEKSVSRDCNFRELTEYRTSIADCLGRCNKDSFALAAEALLKTIAANGGEIKKNGGWAKGREMISRYLSNLDVGESEFRIDDGSGLSRENKLSANAITKVLLDVYKSKNRKLYKDSLAVGGVDGTIRRYFKEAKYRGKVFGKTGYIAGAKSFSGICSGRGGEYIFSILANKTNGKTRKAINDIVKAIIDDN